jgi:hypothetical protein
MAGHAGAKLQLMAIGPQNAYLDQDPQVTMFSSKWEQSSRFAIEAMEDLPLRTPGFGKTAVFKVFPRGDLLGDMHLQIKVPAVQPEVGVGLSLRPMPACSPGTSMPTTAGTISLGGVAVLLSGLPPNSPGTMHLMTGNEGRVWEYERAFAYTDPLTGSTETQVTRWMVAIYFSGMVLVTYERVQGSMQGPESITITRLQKSTSLGVPVDSSVAAFVLPLGDVVTQNDVWEEPVAYALMRRARFVVDDLLLHDHERLWYDMCDSLAVSQSHAHGYTDMLGKGLSMGREHTVILPFKFMCCKFHGQRQAFFPIGLIPSCSVRVEVDVESFGACAPRSPVLPTTEPGLLHMKLVSDRVFLDADERNGMLLQAQRQELTIMYEDAQDVDALNYTEGDGGSVYPVRNLSLDMSELNLPVKALVWVVYPEQVTTMFDYREVVETATLLFGSLERMTANGDQFLQQQRWTHARRIDPRAIYMYSFALNAWQAEPNGAADFSALQNPVLKVTLKPEADAEKLKCKAWGMTYNWLTFKRGRVARVFAT